MNCHRKSFQLLFISRYINTTDFKTSFLGLFQNEVGFSQIHPLLLSTEFTDFVRNFVFGCFLALWLSTVTGTIRCKFRNWFYMVKSNFNLGVVPPFRNLTKKREFKNNLDCTAGPCRGGIFFFRCQRMQLVSRSGFHPQYRRSILGLNRKGVEVQLPFRHCDVRFWLGIKMWQIIPRLVFLGVCLLILRETTVYTHTFIIGSKRI